MVGIVSGGSFGLELTSLRTLGQQGQIGNAAHGRSGEAVYVNVTNGNLILQDVDDLLVARGVDLPALRTYNSRGVPNDDNGDGWINGLALKPLALTGTFNTSGSTFSRTDRDGSVAVYRWSAANTYTCSDGEGPADTLVVLAAENQLEWRDGSTGTTQRYEATGSYRLLSTRDPSGNALSYTYNAAGALACVTTASGDCSFYDYAGANLVQIRTVTAAGATSTSVRYAYNSANRLTSVVVDLSPGDNSVTDGKVYQTNYTYDSVTGRLASLTQSDGTSLAFTYTGTTGNYALASIRDALGRVTTFSYTAGTAPSTTVTGPDGVVTRYSIDATTRLISSIATAGITTATFSYGANGRVSSYRDGAGRVTTFQYDADGNQTQCTDAAATTTRTFDVRNQVLTETVGTAASTGTTRYVYDSGGRNLLRFAISAQGRVTEHRYDALGQRLATLVYAASTYAVSGLPNTWSPAEADMAAWSAVQTPSAVSRTEMSYDARGQLQTRTSYAKVDATGAGVLDGTQSVERFVYDQAGRLLQTIAPTGASTGYTYDGLGRQLTKTDALGQVTLTQYLDAARKIGVTLANGLVRSSVYDAAGRLVSVVEANTAGAALGETKSFHDAAGRLRMTQDPTGVRRWFLYDGLGRQVGEIDANGTLTESTYDASGRLTSTITYASAVSTTGLVDAGGAPVLTVTLASLRPAASSGDLAEWRSYDGAGRLFRVARAVGPSTASVTEYRYDATRLVETVAFGNLLALDGVSVVPGTVAAPAASAQDRSTRNFYDADGRLVGTLDGQESLVRFNYTADGQLGERIAYATAASASLHATGTLAQLTPAASTADQRTVYMRDGQGRVIGEVDAEGYLTETVYDGNGNAATTVRYATRITGSAMPDSMLSSLRPAPASADRTTSRVYDALDRLVQETNPDGVVTAYAYDTGGRLVSTTRAAGTSESRAVLARFDLQGRLVGELSAEGAALLTGGQTQVQVDAIWAQYGMSHSYDAAGRRVRSVDAAGSPTWFFYNVDGALTHTVNALGEVQETRYDVQGRAVEQIAYAGRIATSGLVGGLVSAALTSAVSAVANAAVDSRTTIAYTRNGLATSTVDAEGFSRTFTYNSFGEQIGSTQVLGSGSSLVETIARDRRGLAVGQVSDAAGANVSTSTVFDAFGRAIRTVDGNGNVREQQYDRLGRAVVQRVPSGLMSTSYDAFDRVLAQTDALGWVTTYAYDPTTRSMRVTTPEGISSTTTYTRHGQVQSISDGRGLLTSFVYDRNGRLLQTSTPLTISLNGYDSAGRLVQTTDANGVRVTLAYDAASRLLTRTVDPAGLNLVTAYQYDAKGQRVSVTDPSGVVTTTAYDRKGQRVRQTLDPSGLNLQTTWTYDGAGRTLTVTSPAGAVTQTVYDALGRRTQERVDPAGLNLTRSWSYDRNGNATSSTDALGRVTRFVYDASDRLVFVVDALGNLRQTSYDAAGRVVKTVAFATPVPTGALGAAPSVADIQALAVDQPALDSVEHRVLDKDGRLAWTVDGTGAVVHHEYDGSGNVVARTAYAGRIDMAAWQPGTIPAPVSDSAHDALARTVYDALDRAVFTVDGIGAVVANSYDGNGNLLQRTAYAAAVPVTIAATGAALSAAVALVADASRDAVVRNTFDAANRLTWSADGTGAVTQTAYDKAGNVVRQVEYASPVGPGATPSSVPAGSSDRATSMAYDAANRMVYRIDALRGVTEQAYDAEGRIVRRTAYATPISTIPALGQAASVAAIKSLLTASASLDRTERFAYDPAGRQVFRVDAEGGVTKTQFDANGNAIATVGYAARIEPSSLATQSTLASLQSLVQLDATADRTTRRAYGATGRLAFEVDALGAVTSMQYDGVGRLVRTTRYALAIAAGTSGDLAAISAAIVADSAADRIETVTYNAAGQRVAVTDAAGNTESFTYDALGRKLSFTNKLGAVWTYVSDAAGRTLTETSPAVALASVTSTGDSLVLTPEVTAAVVTRYAYDALGRLLARTEADGRVEQRTTRYEYDALGRQVRVVYPPIGVYDAAADAVTTNGATGAATRIETSRVLESRTFYDALGNAVASVDVGGAVWQKAYDLNGQVAYEVDALGFVTGYRRNAFGEVIALVRYGGGSTLAAVSVSQAAHAANLAQVEAALAAPSFNHASDRTLLTSYDRAGRVTEVVEPTAYVYDASAPTGLQTASVGKTTRTSYDAFGQAIQVQLLRNPRTNAWSVTSRFYDLVGRERATVDALGFLTTRTFDAAGNLAESKEWATALAAGAWTLKTFGLPPSSVDDRVVKFTYDRLDRKTSETRWMVEFSDGPGGTADRGNSVTTYGYDALGHQVRVTNALGNSTYTYFDKLGRVERIAAAARPGGAGTLTPLTEFRRDAHGSVVATIEYANGAASATEAAAVAGAASASDRTQLSRYDVLGRVVQSADANGSSVFSSYDAWGHLAKSWQGVTGVDGITRTLFQLDAYDKVGHLVESRTPASTSALAADGQSVVTLTQAQAGVVTTAMEYNAFGEQTRRGVQGGRQEYFDYDGAGRLWRTNAGDGIDLIQLFDAQGNTSAEIRSAGSARDNIDLLGFVNAQAADASVSTRRIDISRDALGRVVRQQLPTRLELQGGVSVQRTFLTAGAIVSALPAGGSVGGETAPVTWAGMNRVALGWNSLASLGSGDIKVTIEYTTPLVLSSYETEGGGMLQPPASTGGTARSYTSGIFNGDEAAAGVQLDWAETSATADGGVGRISRVIVFKKDVNGAWTSVLDQSPGYGRNSIAIAAPADPRTAVSLEMRVAGTAGDTGWWSAGLVNFGSGLRFDAGGLVAGSYEYRVKVTPAMEAARTIGTGTVSISMPPLNTIATPINFSANGTGLLYWQAPGAGTEQALRYRPLGSSGAWSSLPVKQNSSVAAFDCVDLTGLGGGSYQFELLWTPAGSGSPTAHAVGQFTVTPARPATWVPPVNLPPITGVALGTAVVGATPAYDEFGAPVYYGGTVVPALIWNAADATTVRYRLTGGAWVSLAIDNAAQFHDESRPYGTQKSPINGVPPGTYEVQILTGQPATMQATARLVVSATTPGYYQTVTVQVATQQPIVASYTPIYETRYGIRQVAYQVWVADPPIFIGTDEFGYPVYSYPGHYETRYRTETYSYQVQVGQQPVYARDESGNILYQTIYVPQQQQVWVPGTTPAPTVQVTTPPYTPGYWAPATPTLYGGLSIGTAAGSVAISTTDGGALGQAAGVNGGDRWLRPVVEQKLDRWGNVVEASDPRSLSWTTRYKYNAANQLVMETRPDAAGIIGAASPVRQVYYDKLGRQVAARDANGNVNGQVFDAGGNLVKERHADGGEVVHRYDAFGNKVSTTSAEGKTVGYTFDRLGRMLSMDQGEATVWRANLGNGAEVVATRPIVERWTYDQLGRKLTQTNGNGETLSYTYDMRGNIVATRQPLGQAVRAAFDAQGRKVAEVDANGAVATWTFDYFGRVTSHTDLGGTGYTFAYDKARQLTAQTSTAGQRLTFGYDAAGQQTSITDLAMGKVSSFVFDLAGRRIQERVVQGGVTYQDNHLSYDAQGNLRDVADARVHILMEYDKAGNRTRVASTVDYQGTAGETSSTSDRYFRFDAMNRQIVVDAVDAAGNIGHQGHQLSYDRDGNRTSDTSWGTRVTTGGGGQIIVGFDADGRARYGDQPVTFTRNEGLSTETYRYDRLNRLESVVRDGVQIDLRHYDGANRVVQSGPAANLPQGYADLMNAGLAPGQVNGKEMRINRYDANGRLLHQKLLKTDGTTKADLSWDAAESEQLGGTTFVADGYDAAGNARGYVMRNWDGTNYVNEYVTTLQRAEGYRAGSTVGTSTLMLPGTTAQTYDANGYLVGITDSTQANNSRTFVNDDAGRALWVRQAGNVERQLIVNGEVLGVYGAGVDPANPSSGDNNNPNFANLVDFDFGYARISASYPGASPGAYQVRTGDTLQSIAQAAYGDSKLWYRIAGANGLASSSALKVGQTLTIPAGAGTNSNDGTTFKPYDPSRLQGDTAPSLAMPAQDGGGGCGGIGKLLMVVVAVAVTIYTAGALTGAVGAAETMSAGVGVMNGTVTASTVASTSTMATLGTAGTIAVSAAAGAVAGQIVGLATGTIRSFDWKGVALSAIGAGVAAGPLSGMFGTGPWGAVARYGVGSMVTQGVAVATGLQKRFDWRAVAAAGAAGGVLDGLGGPLSNALGGTPLGNFTAEVVRRAASNTVATVVRGGRLSAEEVATDAFGNVLTGSLVDNMNESAPASKTPVPFPMPETGEHVFLGPTAELPGADLNVNFADRPFSPLPSNTTNDVLLAMGNAPGAAAGRRSTRSAPSLGEQIIGTLSDSGKGIGLWINDTFIRPKGSTNELVQMGAIQLQESSSALAQVGDDGRNAYPTLRAWDGKPSVNTPTHPFYGTFQYEVAKSLPDAAVTIAAPEMFAAKAAPWIAGMLGKTGLLSVGEAGQISTAASRVISVDTATAVNDARIGVNLEPSWLPGTYVTQEIVPAGTRYHMVITEGQAAALMRKEAAFGGFATPEAVTSQVFARDKLAILETFKKDVSRVVTVETTRPQLVNSGLTGPQGAYSGGARQVEFIGTRNLRMVGQPRILPLGGK